MESFTADLATMVRTPLQPDHVAAMWRRGRQVTLEAGDYIQHPGDPITEFPYLLEGELEAVEAVTGKPYGNAAPSPGQFVGELAFLSGARADRGHGCAVPSPAA